MVANKLNEQKRQHRERAQPAHRKKLGLLEKHADYVKRARDFHSKEDRINKLREKASFRNKDEFYFGMIKSKTVKGVHVQSRGNEPLPMDLVTVLKSQDAGYIRSQVAMEQGRVDRLQQQLDALVDTALPPKASTSKAGAGGDDDDEAMMVEEDWDAYSDEEDFGAPKRNHVVFTDDIDAVRTANVSSLLRKRSTPTALPAVALSSGSKAHEKRRKNKGKGKAELLEGVEEKKEREKLEEEIRDEAATHRLHLTEELTARQDRLLALRRAARELDLQRALMSKGAKAPKLATAKDGGRGEKGRREDEWWMGGGKSGTGKEEQGRGGMAPGTYQEEGGEGTGARVWKWKAQRKR